MLVLAMKTMPMISIMMLVLSVYRGGAVLFGSRDVVLPACLPARLPACPPACLPARLPACVFFFACMPLPLCRSRVVTGVRALFIVSLRSTCLGFSIELKSSGLCCLFRVEGYGIEQEQIGSPTRRYCRCYFCGGGISGRSRKMTIQFICLDRRLSEVAAAFTRLPYYTLDGNVMTFWY